MTGKGSTVLRNIAIAACGIIALGAPLATRAHAQGSRKDDVVFNAQGQPMAGATVRVCTASSTGQPCSPLASIYSDNALTMPAANPLTTDGLGNYNFYAAPGRYTVEISGPGIKTYQMANVILPSDPSTPTFTTITTTSGINAFSLALTGNLTVTGSAAVVGSLSVGGAPVPSTGVDNQWSASQRFKGPVPYRDITAYMPAGGCADNVNANAGDPGSTMTISNGSPNATLVGNSGGATYKVGCGLSISGAGPNSTLLMPTGGTATASGSTGVVTYTLSANHNIPISSYNQDTPIVVTGCVNSAFDTNGTQIYNIPTAMTVQIQSGATGTTTGCTVSFLIGTGHGVTGSTDYWYKISAIDKLDGGSPAIGPIEITNGPTTLGRNSSDGLYDFNWIGWPQVPSARMFAVWRSTTSGSSGYSLVGCATTHGWSDWGFTAPCPAWVPSTPSVSGWPESLKTTITAVNGTAITVANAASNSVTAAPAYHDETTFLTQCLTDQKNGQANPSTQAGGESYCLVPPTSAGNAFYFNSDLPFDTLTNNDGAHVEIAGTMFMNTWPWIFGQSAYYVHGIANNITDVNFGLFPATQVYFGKNVPAAFVFHNTDGIENLGTANLTGFGVELNPDPATDVGPSVCADNLYIQMGSGAAGVPWVNDSNTLGVEGCNSGGNTASNIILEPAETGFPASILMTNTTYGGNGQCCISMSGSLLWHHIYVDSPGGLAGGQGSGISYSGISEEHGQTPTGGFLHFDTGNNDGTTNCSGSPCVLPYGTVAPAGLGGISIGINNADASNRTATTISGQNATSISANISGATYYNAICIHGSTLCATGSGSAFPNGTAPANPKTYATVPGLDVALTSDNKYLISGYPIASMAVPNSPGGFDWYFGAPTLVVVQCNTTGGSLADGAYYFKIVEEDNQASPGTTVPSNEGGCTISGGGGSGSVSLQWNDTASYAEKDSRVYYASQPCDVINSCHENSYEIVAIQAGNQTTTVTSVSGWTVDAISNHYTPSALFWNPACVYCAIAPSNISTSGGYQFRGPGVQSAPSGSTVGLRDVNLAPMTFSNLPTCNSTQEGSQRTVTDSMTNTWGATITGSGSDVVLAFCDGTNWTVAGK